MKLLLDTCALLWMGLDPSMLSERAEYALAEKWGGAVRVGDQRIRDRTQVRARQAGAS